MSSEHHFHIRWSNSKIDWKAFSTSDEASKAAEHMKRDGENYVVEEHGAACEACQAFKRGEFLSPRPGRWR